AVHGQVDHRHGRGVRHRPRGGAAVRSGRGARRRLRPIRRRRRDRGHDRGSGRPRDRAADGRGARGGRGPGRRHRGRALRRTRRVLGQRRGDGRGARRLLRRNSRRLAGAAASQPRRAVLGGEARGANYRRAGRRRDHLHRVGRRHPFGGGTGALFRVQGGGDQPRPDRRAAAGGHGGAGKRDLPRADRDGHDAADVRAGAGQGGRGEDRPAQPAEARRSAGGDRAGGAVPRLRRGELRQRPGGRGGRRAIELASVRAAAAGAGGGL
ncbi:MAG: 3-oxoacyl-[acyl-carrier protein] reductase, partial [uncultured Sphingomonadaceae bacterium]